MASNENEDSRRAAPEEERAAKPSPPGPSKAESELDRAFVAKVAIYERGLSAGVGVKALNRKRLAAELDDPARRGALKDRVMRRIDRAVSDAGVSYGVDAEAVAEAADVFLQDVEQDSDQVVARKVAKGDPPEPGQDGRLEYPLNPDSLPMHRVAGVPVTSRRRWFRMVHKGETLVQAFPPKAGKDGRSVTGESIEPGAKPKEMPLSRVMGTNTAVEEDRLIAECEGACEESASGRLRVVPEVTVDVVDALTGNLPEAGVSRANILVKGDVKSGYGVASSESVFVGAGKVGGIVEQRARVSAASLVVNGTILGAPEDAAPGGGEPNAVDVQEVCVAREIEGGGVSAGQILVVGDSRLARLNADGAIRVGGDLVGGQTACRQALIVGGDIGSEEGGSRTRVIVPRMGGPSRQQKRLAVAIFRQRKALAEIQERLNTLETTAVKRSEPDPYWAALLSGDFRKPQSSVEANTLRQFKDMLNEKKACQRSMAEVRLAVRQLQEQAEAELEEEAAQDVRIRVGGRLYLDASLEATVEVADEAMESQVTYMVEEKRFRNHMVKDIQSELSRQARAYLEAQSGHVAERRHAIDKMFEGSEQRPAGPQVKHRRFEIPFTWSEQEDDGGEPGALHITSTAFVATSEPGHLYVRTVAAVREVLEGVEIVISQQGPRVEFSVGTVDRPQAGWQEDAEVLQVLDGIVVRAISAREFLEGKEASDGPVAEA